MLRTMTTNNHCTKFGFTAIAIFFVAVQIVSSAVPLAGQSSKPACFAPEYHQFDFWLGDWDSFDFGTTTQDAHIRVTRMLDGCVIHEDYQSVDGHKGQSFSIYDASRKVWHQTWVTNRGQLLVIEGEFQTGEMVLSGSDLTSTGEKREVRGVWKPVEGGVRETAVVSFDGGKTWKPWFDLIFRAHSPYNAARSMPSLTADEKDADTRAISALDTQYQAAVKANDASTMDRLLADDFILVTGSGKTFSKADLLAEARSASTHYDHQEDTNQTVRILGDSAVITAKLWAQGTENGKPFDYSLWFSDTYVRTSTGWRYAFAQASSPLRKPSLSQR
jgi:ketosteroid isomerase-like protein